MSHNRYKALTIFFFSILFMAHLNAQVTIGSKEAPNQGAILDLKEEGTTTKGLAMPRVGLSSLTIKDNSNNLATTVKGASETWDPTAHIGLLVYHAEEYDACDPYSIPNGLYVWTGTEWQAQFTLPQDAPEVKIYADTRDGKVDLYRYRKFGDAGEWMLENLRYVQPGMKAALIGDDETDQCYTYPNPVEADPAAVPTSWRPNQGILYTYAAATLGAQDNVTEIEQGQEGEDQGYTHPIIQGICPPGWHLPSDREWNELEKEIYNHPNKYSSYGLVNGLSPFNPNAWDPEWNTTNNPRGANGETGHGLAMLSTCHPVASPKPYTFGKSSSAGQGGFDILLVGTVEKDAFELEYGYGTYFWASSKSFEEIWIRAFFSDVSSPPNPEAPNPYPAVVRGSVEASFIPLSVRCKKNE